MKFIKNIIYILAIVLMIGQASAANVAISPISKTVNMGQTFSVNVSIDPTGAYIAGAQLNLVYNPSAIRINDITEGNFLKQNGASTFFNGGTINNTQGAATNIYSAILGPYNVSSAGIFIKINATAIASSGTSAINLLNVKVIDPNGVPVPLTINNGSVIINTPPVLAAIGNQAVDEGQNLTFTLSATDGDGGILTYSASNLPPGATFNSVTQTFMWTPGYTQSGTYTNVHFEVSDGSLTAFENISITVNNVNRAPTFTSTPENGSTFNETDSILISVMANDLDNDPLSYIIKIDGVQVTATPNFTWITNYSSSGIHNVNISVSDGTAIVQSTIALNINNVYPRYDVNENGVVDIGDITIIGQHFDEVVTAPYPRYDVNMDGIINIADLTITGQHFGENT